MIQLIRFGTDGVRGVANQDLTAEMAYNLGRASAHVLNKGSTKARILVGCDTRISCDMLEAALIAGICSVGATVHTVGVVPTPAIAYLVKKYDMDAGVMISASHNEVKDNGIKIFDGQGYKLSDQTEEEIANLINSGGLQSLDSPIGKALGRKIVVETALEDYEEFLLSTVEGLDLTGLKIGIDCANGATYQLAPSVLKRLGAEVFSYYDKPNGININENCGSTHMDDIALKVNLYKLDLGIAFDGDGDRCLMVDNKGQILDGDEIMSILGTHFKENGVLKKNTIVGTVMSNLGLFKMGEEQNIEILKTAVGDRYVLEAMLKDGYNFGGEQSGHIIFLDHTSTGDGVLTALQLLKVLKEKGKTLSDLNTLMKKYPQVMINAKVENSKKYSYEENQQINDAIKELDKKFAGNGRVLIRPSGTEPVVRVMIEGNDIDEITAEAQTMVKLIEKTLA